MLLIFLPSLKCMSHEQLKNFLTKNRTRIWFSSQSYPRSDNAYCSLCCMNITKNPVGKTCGRHTLCIYEKGKVGPACKDSVNLGFSEEEKVAIVDLHNTIRSLVATGEEIRGAPGPQYKAANMRAVEWNDELEELAKRWVSQCIYGHDACRDLERYPVGQNIARGNGFLNDDIAYIADWYSSVDEFDRAWISEYQLPYLDIRTQYTQLVWAETYQIGCARIVFQGPESPLVSYREHFVCNYGPSGNIPGHPVYRIGEPCSQCPPGTGCTLEYPGLCGQEPFFNITYIKKPQQAVSAPITPRSGSGVVRASFLLYISVYFLIL
nr:unnamed protein product [Callosobruchus analis]